MVKVEIIMDKQGDKEANANIPNPTYTDVQRHPKFYFDGTLIFIQLANTLYSVHKSQLLKSEAFSKWFELQATSPRPEERSEGLSPENPIVLEGIEVLDFEAFLKVLYAPQYSGDRPPLEVGPIISAYRLAVLWQFSELRDYLLSLADGSFDDFDRIAFAAAFGLKEWLLDPHFNLWQREDQLSLEEAKKIGIDSLLVISKLREEFPIHRIGSDRRRSSQCKGVEKTTYNHNTRSNVYPYNSTCTPNPPTYEHCSACLTKGSLPEADEVRDTVKARLQEWIDGNAKGNI